ncbi:MAG TPA: orotidine-5'-phosphate decarboxylase [Planctomycetota bacterium]|nr:orotidine-5'-phosphate decarboxylase [Planctomycetota bacterium]
MDAFADRLDAAVQAKHSPLCVGIDPRLDKLPADVRAAAKGDAGEALLRFGLEILDLVGPHAACVKPNIAFFEAHGLAGLRAYAGILRGARERGLLAIGDVKRGDLGTTAEAYAQAHLAPGSDFEADAITVAPYMGGDSVAPLVEAAVRSGKGLFVLVRTSNPGAKELQDLACGDRLVYERTADLVRAWGEPHRGRGGLSCVGAVVGATWPDQARRLRAVLPSTPFLVPGYGAQGATAADVAAAFLPGARGAVVNASRSVVFPASKDPSASWRDLVVAAARAAKEELDAAARRAA